MPARTTSTPMDKQVLDLGMVSLVDHMASDQKVTGAARVSTGKGPEYTSKGETADAKLINFLMSNGHGTPFEHAVFQFFVKAPIFVVREWQRHRIGSYNEQSGRYSEFKPEFYVPDHIRVPHHENKQQSVQRDPFVNQPRSTEALIADINNACVKSFTDYQELLRMGVAREMARMVLPVSMYSSFWWTVNARSLMNFLMLRNAEAAQWEIRQYAEVVEDSFAETMPWTHAAFVAAGRRAP